MDATAAPTDLPEGTSQALHPRTRVVWVVQAWLTVVVLAVAAAVGLWFLLPVLAVTVLAVAVLAGGLVATLWARLAWARWHWTVWDDAIELRHGVVIRRESLVPFHRIQQIDVTRGPLERALGLSSLVLRTAAATSDAGIPGIAHERADVLRHRLLERAGLDDAV